MGPVPEKVPCIEDVDPITNQKAGECEIEVGDAPTYSQEEEPEAQMLTKTVTRPTKLQTMKTFSNNNDVVKVPEEEPQTSIGIQAKTDTSSEIPTTDAVFEKARMVVVKVIDRKSQALIVQRSTEMAENSLDKEMLSGTLHLPEEHATLQKGSQQNDKMNESSEESDQQTRCHQDPEAMAVENGAEKAITISNELSDVIPKAVSDSQKKPQSESSISAEQKNKVKDHVEKSSVMAATAIGRKMNTSQACIRDNVESEERKAVQEDQQMTSSAIETKQESVSVLVNSEELKDSVGNAENNVVNIESPGAHNSMKQSKANDNVVPEDVNVNISEQKVEKANNEQSSSVIEKEKLNKHERKGR